LEVWLDGGMRERKLAINRPRGQLEVCLDGEMRERKLAINWPRGQLGGG